MVTTLQDVFTPSQTVDGVDYFLGEPLIYFGAALSDYGRDYEIEVQLKGVEYPTKLKLGQAIEAIQSGSWVPGPEVMERYAAIEAEYPGLPLRTIEDFGFFTYLDPRSTEPDGQRAFDPLGEYDDLPGEFIGRLPAAHFGTMRKLIQHGLAEGGYIGEVGEKLNGLELRYFDRQFVPSRDQVYGRDTSFYLYFFYTEEKNLLAWKTGIDSKFQRDGIYTLVGGKVSRHDSYKDFPPKTMLTRAKFFDHSTGEKFVG